MFDVGIKFLEGFGNFPRVEVACGGGFGGTVFRHDGEGLLEGGHEVIGHIIQALGHEILELLSDKLDLSGRFEFP